LKNLYILLFLGISLISLGQNQSKGKLSGQVVEANSNNPIPFSSVRVQTANPVKLITGAIANEKGEFNIEVNQGIYDVIIESVGFEATTLKGVQISKTTQMGTISAKASSQTLSEVTVKGQKASMELNLDKRIFNVGTDAANKGATAAEILGNLPSVQVNGEGGVSLRGSENVRILVDGKPSTLVGINGSSGLQSLQGNLIDKVEIITNPSARYEAEGMAGIINIVLKKNQTKDSTEPLNPIWGIRRILGGLPSSTTVRTS